MNNKSNKHYVNGEREQPSHPVRVPVHKQSSLSVKPRPGYRTVIINDSPGRIDSFIKAGYEIRQDAGASNLATKTLQQSSTEGAPFRIRVNERHDAQTQYAYVMDIPEELAAQDDEDRAAESREHIKQIDPENRLSNIKPFGKLDLNDKPVFEGPRKRY